MAVIFVVKSVPGFRAFLDQLCEHYSVHILDTNQNAIRQIANIIGNDSNLGSLHIFSHGQPGVLKFSSGSITTDNAKNFSKDLIITAVTTDDTIMAIMHKKYNIHGVQFHPESIKTNIGIKILKNFIKYKNQ